MIPKVKGYEWQKELKITFFTANTRKSTEVYMQINKRNNGWCFRADFLTRRLGIFLTVSESDASADISPEKVHSLLQENNMEDFSLEAIELAVASSQATLSNMSEVCNLLKAFNRTVRGFAVKIGPVNTGTSSLNYFDLPGQCSIDLDWRECAQSNSNESLVKVLDAIQSVRVVKQLKLHLSKTQTTSHTMELLLNIVNLKLAELECLNLTFQRYIDSSAFVNLQQTTINRSLKTLHLDFQSASLNLRGSQYLSSFLGSLSNLQDLKLNLRYNRLEDQSVECILLSLSQQQLISLDLAIGCNPFKEAGTDSIIKFLESKKASLKHLNLDLRMFQTSQNFFSRLPNFVSLQTLELNFAMTEFLQPEENLLSLAALIPSIPELTAFSLNLSMSNLKNCQDIEALLVSIGQIKHLKQLKLNLTGTSFNQKRMQALENCLFEHEKNLQILELDLDLRQTCRGNQCIYFDILKLIEMHFPQLLHLEISEIAKMKGFFFKGVLQQHQRVISKLSLKRKLINSLLAIKNSIVFENFRKEIAEEISSFLAESKYTMQQVQSRTPPPPAASILPCKC